MVTTVKTATQERRDLYRRMIKDGEVGRGSGYTNVRGITWNLAVSDAKALATALNAWAIQQDRKGLS